MPSDERIQYTEQIRSSFGDLGLVGLHKRSEPEVSSTKGLHASLCNVSLWVSGTEGGIQALHSMLLLL